MAAIGEPKRHQPAWKSPPEHITGPTQLLSRLLEQVDREHGLVSLAQARRILIASDYGGDHQTATHVVYSFLCIDLDRSQGALQHWAALRRKPDFSDGRRMAFKKLRDGVRRKYLPEYLRGLPLLFGNCVTIAIHRGLELEKKKPPRPESDPALLAMLARLTSGTRTKLIAIGHILALLGSGFSREGQSLLWVSDNDEIVENASRLSDANELCGNLLNHYLQHDLHAYGLLTPTEMGPERLIAEDLLSVADLFAGSICEVISRGPSEYISFPQGEMYRTSPQLSSKCLDILQPTDESESATFRCVNCRLDPESETTLRIRPMFFNYRVTA